MLVDGVGVGAAAGGGGGVRVEGGGADLEELRGEEGVFFEQAVELGAVVEEDAVRVEGFLGLWWWWGGGGFRERFVGGVGFFVDAIAGDGAAGWGW